jgi:hypothetical protein
MQDTAFCPVYPDIHGLANVEGTADTASQNSGGIASPEQTPVGAKVVVPNKEAGHINHSRSPQRELHCHSEI